VAVIGSLREINQDVRIKNSFEVVNLELHQGSFTWFSVADESGELLPAILIIDNPNQALTHIEVC
jgi:hypothetical protein